MSTPIYQSPASRRTRLLQVFCRYRDYGGEEGSVYRIGDALAQHYDIGVFLASSNKVFSGGAFSKGVGVAKAFVNWTLVKQLRRYQEIGKYDYWVIHNVFPVMSPSVYALAFELGVPVIQYLHNYRLGCVNGFFLNHGQPCQVCMHGNFLPAFQTACWHESRIQSGLMGAILKRTRNLGVLQNVRRWVAISEAQKAEHVAMGIPEENIRVIYHFLEAKEPPLPYPGQGDVLFVGRLSQEKGVDRLLKAWEKIQDCGRLLWIVGDGPEKAGLEEMVAKKGLKNVRFTGFLNQDEMSEIWEKTACSVVPSIWKEPFGMVILESWSKGRPVVAHRIGALPELVEEGQNGCLVPPEDSEAMAEAILNILQNPGLGEEMGRKGFSKLETDFTRQRWSDQFQDLVP